MRDRTPGNAAPLSVNEDWLATKKWTQDEIAARTNALVSHALEYWTGV